MGRPRIGTGVAPRVSNAKRRGDAGEWREIPSSCDKPIPPWPDYHIADPTWVAKWEELWKLPQANVWHEVGMADVVAVYVKALIRLGWEDAPKATDINAVRQLSIELLLTPIALRGARLVIAGSDEAAQLRNVVQLVQAAKPGEDGDEVSMKSRFKRVEPKEAPSVG